MLILKYLFILSSSHFKKKIRETKKNNPDVIWSFAHIAEYLNAGIKKIIEDRINKIFLSTFLNLIFNAIYKKNGIKDDTII